MNLYDLPVHPDTDSMPMMSESEISLLALDISQNGLNEPLVIADLEYPEKTVTYLIDGRNRRTACKELQLKPPKYRVLQGNPAEIQAFIFSQNFHRKNLTLDQQAMITATMYSSKEHYEKLKKMNIAIPFNGKSIRKARSVLKHAHDAAEAVRLGTLPLEEAYHLAIMHKEMASPRLILQVAEGELSIKEAYSEWLEEKKIQAQEIEAVKEQLNKMSEVAIYFSDQLPGDRLRELGIPVAAKIDARIADGLFNLINFVEKIDTVNENH